MDWPNVIVSLLSGIIGAVFGALLSGYFVYKTTKMHLAHDDVLQKEKTKREEQANRPEFQIVSHKYSPNINNNKANIEVVVALIKGFDGTFMIYEKDIFKENNLAEIVYEFKNVGKTDIACLWVASNKPRTVALHKYSEFKLIDKKQQILSYRCCHDIIIRTQDTISVKFIFERDKSANSFIEAAIVLWIEDINGEWWSQPLFFPENKIYKASKSTQSEFKSYTSENIGLDCFRNPWKW